MDTDTHDLDDLLDEARSVDPRPPALVPGGWAVFLLALVALDLGSLFFGYVPWSGGRAGLHRGDAFLGMIVGLALGLALGLVAGLAASRRATRLGVSEAEAELARGEPVFPTGLRQRPEVVGWLALIALVLLSMVFGRLADSGPSHSAAQLFIFLNGVAGMALPLLWRRFLRANAAFRVWLDEKNSPFDAGAAARTAAHRARLADIQARIEAGERALRERLDRLPRVAPPWYLAPLAIWLVPLPAIVLDLLLLFSRGARLGAGSLAHAGPGAVIWGMLVHWVWGAIALGVLWALLSWYYVEVSDQVSRRWDGRDWSAGISAIALEVALGLIGLTLLVGLIGGGGLRFACWNLAAPSFLLFGVLRDIHDTAREHHVRGLQRQMPVEDHEEAV